MKNFLCLIFAAAVLAPAAGALAAGPQATSLDQLLEQVRESASQNAALNQQRQQQFLQQRDQQAQILAAAKQALTTEQARNAQLQAGFDSNQKILNGLVGQLRAREGDFSQVFDTARQAAAGLKTTLDDSLVSAQYPGRGVFLARLAESRGLPSLADLRRLWFLMQQEMIEEGAVAKFPAAITREDGTQANGSVVRVGEFNAINGDEFLQYLPETGALVQLNRQPAAQFRRQAAALYAATAGVLPMPLDPSGGSLLGKLVSQPSFAERIAQGHAAGWIIIILGIIGLLIVIERLVYLALAGRRIRAQLATSKPDFNNPLGRLLAAFNEAKISDAETLELRMDEALLKERPLIEARLGFLRIIALVAVLLGLLGTVVGLMKTFQAMNLFGASTSLVANGIAAALVSTWLGLLVAVVMLFCHGLLASRGQALLQQLEEQIAGIIAARTQNPAAARAAK